MTTDASASLKTLDASAQALDHTLVDLTDEQAHGPSGLADWTRGHVLTHLARNADALVNLATWARTGEETPMYPSRERRNADIEAGSGRPASDLVADVRQSQARLMTALDELEGEQWDAPTIRWGYDDRLILGRDIPWLRRIEVEVHHVDLDLGYTMAHWPESFVEQMLVEVTAEFSAREGVPGFQLVGNDDEGRWTVGSGGPVIGGPPPALLGWMLGRSDGAVLHGEAGLPDIGTWR